MKKTTLSYLFPIVAALRGVFLLPINARAAAGDLYVADLDYNAIFRFTPAGVKSTFASGLSGPMGLAFDRGGNLFVADAAPQGVGIPPSFSAILKFAPDGTRSTFALIGISPLSMAIDSAGNLFLTNSSEITKVVPDGTQSTFASNVDGAWGLAFDKLGNLYVGGNSNSILKFTPDGSRSTFVSFPGPVFSATGLAFDAKGDLFLIYGSSILKVTPSGGMTTFATGGFSYPLAFDGEGNLFATLDAYNATEPAIVKFTPAGTRTTFASGEAFLTALAFEPVVEKLRNISARGLVGTGENVLIGGFLAGGNALANNAVIIRAIGPSLSRDGITNPLSDPMLELHNASGAVIATNDNWQDTQATQIRASHLAPTDPHEAAIYATLPAGAYTAIVRGVSSATGVAVVEVYSLGQ